jgi:rod shape determining protein RodA
MHVARFVFLVMAMVIARMPRTGSGGQPCRSMAPGALLVLVELIGGIGGGSQRWLNLGFMTLQPSELMKPGIVLVLSWFYSVLPTARRALARHRSRRRARGLPGGLRDAPA